LPVKRTISLMILKIMVLTMSQPFIIKSDVFLRYQHGDGVSILERERLNITQNMLK
jgi:hypothetical protein